MSVSGSKVYVTEVHEGGCMTLLCPQAPRTWALLVLGLVAVVASVSVVCDVESTVPGFLRVSTGDTKGCGTSSQSLSHRIWGKSFPKLSGEWGRCLDLWYSGHSCGTTGWDGTFSRSCGRITGDAGSLAPVTLDLRFWNTKENFLESMGVIVVGAGAWSSVSCFCGAMAPRWYSVYDLRDTQKWYPGFCH
jgi:hypothetical protein